MSPRRRNLLGSDGFLDRQSNQARRLLNVQRAPIRSEQIFVTPEEAARRRKRLYQNYFAGPVPVSELPPSSGVFVLGLSNDLEEGGLYRLDGNEWSPISTITFGPGFEVWGQSSTAKKLGLDHFLIRADELWRSQDDGVTWGMLRFMTGGGAGITIDAGGRLWLGDGQDLQYSDDRGDSWTTVETLPGWVFGACAHPTDENIVVFTGFHDPDNTMLVSVTTDRGSSFTTYSISLASGTFNEIPWFVTESNQAIFLESGRLVIFEQFFATSGPGPDPSTLTILYSDNPVAGAGSFTRVNLATGTLDSLDWGNPVLGLTRSWGKLFALAGRTDVFAEPGMQVQDIFISEDDAESWSVLPLPPLANFEHIIGGFYEASRDRLIVHTSFGDGVEPRVFASTPPGENWVDLAIPSHNIPGAYMGIWTSGLGDPSDSSDFATGSRAS